MRETCWTGWVPRLTLDETLSHAGRQEGICRCHPQVDDVVAMVDALVAVTDALHTPVFSVMTTATTDLDNFADGFPSLAIHRREAAECIGRRVPGRRASGRYHPRNLP